MVVALDAGEALGFVLAVAGPVGACALLAGPAVLRATWPAIVAIAMPPVPATVYTPKLAL